LARHADRMATIEAAMQRLEARTKGEAEAERQRRAAAEAERQRTGQRRRGRAPKEVDEMPDDTAQMRCTDSALPIMQTTNKGGDYCGNAHASVDGAYQSIVACEVTAEANEKQQALPMAQWTAAHLAPAAIERPKDAAGTAQKMPATSDSGSYSAAAAAAVEQRGFDPSMATGRQRHHVPAAEVAEPPTTAQERRTAQVHTAEERALYAQRKVIVEPVCGQIKDARGVRRFLLRGLATRRGEGSLVGLTHNLLQLWRYAYAPIAV
jgi:Transposase DDE domain